MLTEDNTQKVLKLFFDGPLVRLHVREVARRTELSPPGVKKILEALEKDKLLIREPTPVVVDFRGNYDSEIFIAWKRSVNLFSLYSSGLVDALAGFYGVPECIVAFGSYAKGEDAKSSDVDIAIVTSVDQPFSSGQFEEILNRKISLHTIKDLKRADGEFINSIANGIVLYGYLEVR